MNMIIAKNAKAYAAAPKNMLIAPIFCVFMGVLFASFGFFSKRGPFDLVFILGVGFVVFGIVSYIRNRAIFSDADNN